MTGWVVFLFPAAVLLVTALQRLLYKHGWKRGLTLTVDFSAKTVFEGDTLVMTETLHNAKLLPLPLVEVVLLSRAFVPLESVAAEDSTASGGPDKNTQLFSLPAYRRVSADTHYICAKRGYYQLKEFLVSGCNWMMTGWESLFMEAGGAVTVYPRVIETENVKVPYRLLAGEIQARRFIDPDPFAFRGIREYHPGDRLKTINFKATARTGALKTNLYDGTVSQEIWLVLNLQEHMSLSDPVLWEGAIRLAAFLARYYIGEGIPTGLVTNGLDGETDTPEQVPPGTSPAHVYRIYDALAHIDLSKRTRPMTDILQTHKADIDRVYLLISRYDGADLREWFETTRPFGGFWVVPYRKGDNKIQAIFEERVAGQEVS